MERADAGEELVELERFGEVVVSARVQSAHHVLHGVAGGEHEDRRGSSLASQLIGDLESVLFGQQQIEEDDIVVVGMCPHRGLLTIGRHIDDVALFSQAMCDESGHLGIVFHDEDLHDSISGTYVNRTESRPEDLFRIRRRGARARNALPCQR